MCINTRKKINDSKRASIEHRHRYHLLAVQITWCLVENWPWTSLLKFWPTPCHSILYSKTGKYIKISCTVLPYFGALSFRHKCILYVHIFFTQMIPFTRPFLSWLMMSYFNRSWYLFSTKFFLPIQLFKWKG